MYDIYDTYILCIIKKHIYQHLMGIFQMFAFVMIIQKYIFELVKAFDTVKENNHRLFTGPSLAQEYDLS